MLATASCVLLASTSGLATGSSQSEIVVQTPANWKPPPIAARIVSTATLRYIDQRATPSPCACGGCSCTYADGSPPKTMNSIRNV